MAVSMDVLPACISVYHKHACTHRGTGCLESVTDGCSRSVSAGNIFSRAEAFSMWMKTPFGELSTFHKLLTLQS